VHEAFSLLELYMGVVSADMGSSEVEESMLANKRDKRPLEALSAGCRGQVRDIKVRLL
jgi:hypothetical protein